MHYVYLIKSKHKDWKYIGVTGDLRKRFNEHQEGVSTATKAHKPFLLLYYEAYQKPKDARMREQLLKKNSSLKEELFSRFY